MIDFVAFERLHGPAIQCVTADPDTVSSYRGRLPDPLISSWMSPGWCAYGEGLIWVVNPNTLADLLEDWIENSNDPPIVIARTAFADMFLWGQDGVHFLSVHYGRITRVSNDIEQFFDDFLCSPKNIQGILRFDLFRQILDALGGLKSNECYAFVPALALGGTEVLDSVEKVSMREHIGFLTQIVID